MPDKKPTPKKMTEADLLEFVQRRSAEIKKAPGTPKRRMPKVTRMTSKGQAAALRMQGNLFKAGFTTAEQATNAWRGTPTIGHDEGTRNVGPTDFGTNYCHGKETGNR
jgi:hypothetical protein